MSNKDTKHLARFRSKLLADEEILLSVPASKLGSVTTGELVLTNVRLCFIRAGALREIFETLPVEDVSSIDSQVSMGARQVVFCTRNNSLGVQCANDDKIRAFEALLAQSGVAHETSGISHNKHVAKFRTKLKQDEEIVCSVSAAKWESPLVGELILTTDRVCFFKAGFAGDTFETIPITRLSSVEFKSSLGIKKLTLHASHDELCVQVTGSKASSDFFQSKLESVRASGSGTPVLSALAPSLVEQIKGISELRSQGILTEDEFQRKKTELLAKM